MPHLMNWTKEEGTERLQAGEVASWIPWTSTQPPPAKPPSPEDLETGVGEQFVQVFGDRGMEVSRQSSLFTCVSGFFPDQPAGDRA